MRKKVPYKPVRKFTQGKKKQPGRWSAIDRISKDKIRLLVEDGWSDSRIANFFGITSEGFRNYKKQHPAFFKDLSDWRAEAAKEVEKSLFKRAQDRDVEEVTEEEGRNDKVGNFKSKKVLKKTVLADVEAAKFILPNHMPNQYKNRQDNKNINLNGQPDDKTFTDKFFGVDGT